LKQLLEKLKKAQSYGFQLDEATDISDEVQLILYCRFSEKGNKRHYPDVQYCLKVGVCTTAQAIFAKLN